MTTSPTPRDARVSLTRVVDALTTLDLRPVHRGRHVQALCPAHEDRAPSLSIDHDARTGQTLVFCQAGCETGDVVAALGLTLSDLYDEAPRRPDGPSTPRPAPPRQAPTRRAPASRPAARRGPACLDQYDEHDPVETTRYPYATEDGTVVGHKTRSRCRRDGCPETKIFAWRKLDSQGRERGGMPSPLPLYRLPDALAAIERGDPVYVTEGEKDADAITAAGAAAVTMGAAAKGNSGGSWKPHHTRALTGAHVIVCADRDTPGRRSAEIIARELHPVAASVRIVQAAVGHDPHDHLTAGRSLADLEPVDPSPDAHPDAAAGPADGEPAGETLADVVPIHGASDPERGEREVPGQPGWTFTPGVGVWSERRRVLDWCPTAERLVIVPGADTDTIREARVTLTVGPDTATVSLADVHSGAVWGRDFPHCPGAAGRSTRDALTNAITSQLADVPRVYTTPRWVHDDHGRHRLILPPADITPSGYGRTGGTLDGHRELLRLIASQPVVALIAGLATASPYLAPLGRGSCVAHLVGQTSQGKSSALIAAAAIFGDPAGERGGVMRSWNATPKGITSQAIGLRVLPLVRDELGATGTGALRAGVAVDLVHQLTQGGDRDAATRTGDPRASRGSWAGALLSSGNTSIVEAARDPAIAVRVLEIPGPFTSGREISDRLRHAAVTHYGHALHALVDDGPTPAEVADVITSGEDALTRHGLPRPDGAAAGRVWDHLAVALAGARVLADVLDVPDLARGALAGAHHAYPHVTGGYAAEDHSTGLLLIQAIEDHYAENPGLWPTRQGYDEATKAGAGARASRLAGLDLTDETGTYHDVTLGVFPRALDEIAERADLDTAVALADLDTHGRLYRTDRKNRAAQIKAGGRKHRAYLITETRPTPGTDPGTDPGRYTPDPLTSCVPPVPTVPTDSREVCVQGPRAVCPVESGGCGLPYPEADHESGRADEGLVCLACFDRQRLRGRRGTDDVPETAPLPLERDETPTGGQTPPVAEPQGGQGSPRRAAGTPEPGSRSRGHSGAQAPPREGVTDEMITAARGVLPGRTHAQTWAALDALAEATGGLLWVVGRGAAGELRTAEGAGSVGRAWMAATLSSGQRALARGDVESLTTPLPGDPDRAPAGWDTPPLVTADYVDPATPPVAGEWLLQLDVNGQYPNAAGISLGAGEPFTVTTQTHGQDRVDALAAADIFGSERPGYVRLAEDIETDHPALAGRLTAGLALPAPIARYLVRRRGLTLPIDGVTAWPERGAYLRPWRERISTGRDRLREACAGEGRTAEDHQAAADALRLLKIGANAGIGMLRSADNRDARLFRPDWWDMIVSEATVRALISLDRCTERGAPPVGLYRDGAFFRSHSPIADPITDAPGCRIGTGLGAWKVERHTPVGEDTITAFQGGPNPLITHAKQQASQNARNRDGFKITQEGAR